MCFETSYPIATCDMHQQEADVGLPPESDNLGHHFDAAGTFSRSGQLCFPHDSLLRVAHYCRYLDGDGHLQAQKRLLNESYFNTEYLQRICQRSPPDCVTGFGRVIARLTQVFVR